MLREAQFDESPGDSHPEYPDPVNAPISTSEQASGRRPRPCTPLETVHFSGPTPAHYMTYGPHVPQKKYSVPTGSSHMFHVEKDKRDPPIRFVLQGTTDRTQYGILLKDALLSRVIYLKGCDDLVFEGKQSVSISIRIGVSPVPFTLASIQCLRRITFIRLQWRGYPPRSRQIRIRDFRNPPRPITRAMLAKNVAKCVQRFIHVRRNDSVLILAWVAEYSLT
jgi:hypothetical protein